MSRTRPPVDYIERTRDQYAAMGYPPYRWVTNADVPPWALVTKPLAGSRIGLVASGGIYVAGQIAFHYKDDTSFRLVDMETPTSDLRATHFAYDLTDARRDPNVVFPIDTLRALAAERFIGGVSRSVRDSAAALDATAGPVPGDPYAAPYQSRPFLEEASTPPAGSSPPLSHFVFRYLADAATGSKPVWCPKGVQVRESTLALNRASTADSSPALTTGQITYPQRWNF